MTDAPPPWSPQPAYQPAGIVGGQRYTLSNDERTMGMLSHLLGLFSFLGPLVIFLVKGKESSFVRDQSAEALNFQLTLLIGYVVSMVLLIVLIGFLLLFAIVIIHFVYGIIGAIRANEGIAYRYPLCIRMVR